MAKGGSEDFVIAVDTREQRPYSFPHCELKALAAGDYSLVNYETRIAIERKSKADCYSSLGRGRARFKREVERLARLEYAAIVIECSLDDFLTPPPFSQMSPKAAINTLVGWSVKYRICVFFAGSRRHGRTLTYRLLEKFHRYDKERSLGRP
ncbi:MAG: ERCC4 domain-containing protein [Elusimicrobiota bacterium]